jgi:phage FluMu gp28-like protein
MTSRSHSPTDRSAPAGRAKENKSGLTRADGPVSTGCRSPLEDSAAPSRRGLGIIGTECRSPLEDSAVIGTESREVSGGAGATPPNRRGKVNVVDLDGAVLKNDTVLRRYQRRWAKDEHRFTIAVKSAQIGYSTATAAWAVDRCLVIPNRTIIFLSRSERQSLELAHRAKEWLDGYHGVAADWLEATPFGGTSTLQHEIRFPNGSRIIALAANPDTARGYTGDVVLDEFAFHADSQAIFTAVYRQVSLGYHMRILSTPNGQRGKFWELARTLGLDLGRAPEDQPIRVGTRTDPSRVFGPLTDAARLEARPEDQPISAGKSGVRSLQSKSKIENPKSKIVNPWSGHWCDLFLAVKSGLPVDPREVQAGCDEDTWLQEYCCQFISQYSEWIPCELFQQCVSSEIDPLNHWSIDSLKAQSNQSMNQWRNEPILYAGWDVARNQDLSVIWLSELVGDVSWTRGVIEMRNTPTPDQLREARALMPFVRRLAIDKTGMGVVIFETLEREFPGQVEGVQFSQQKKEAMAVLAKRRMEEMKVRLPDSDAVRQAFRAVKKTVNAVGQVRFDAEHDARSGHADHWWAFCLAETAAQQPVYRFKDVAMLVGRPITSGLMQIVL